MALAKQKAPTDPAEVTSLDDFLCFAVYSANLAIHRALKPVLDGLGLTYSQYIVLVALYEHDDQTVSALGEKLHLDSSTLTPLLKRMEAMGHLTRQRDPEDERQVRVRLTPQARKVREQAFAYRGGMIDAMGLSADEYWKLREQMADLRSKLSKLTPAET